MKPSPTLRKRLREMLARAWPPHCIVCGGAGFNGTVDLCPGCRADLPYIATACPRCAAPGPAGLPCGHCVTTPPPFDSALSPLTFEFPVDTLVRGLKFHRRLAAGRVLGDVLARHIASCSPVLPGVIVPVPLAPGRLKERGFNQAAEIAGPVAKALGVPVAGRHVRRIRNTLEQTGLDARTRRRNVRDAFRVMRALPSLHVAIVDDVMTTGSTVGALAATLKENGAERVDAWTVARAT